MILQSSESKPILIEIRTVIEIFQKRILSPIVDACMEQSFFLVDDLKDL
jgi:hypothetical protein